LSLVFGGGLFNDLLMSLSNSLVAEPDDLKSLSGFFFTVASFVQFGEFYCSKNKTLLAFIILV
jgi:hypothetical protein